MTLSAPKTTLIAASVLVILVVVGGTIYEQHPQFYPYLAMQSGEPLEVRFIQYGIPDRNKCVTRVKRMVNAMLSKCVECTIMEALCLEKLNPRQREILSGQPVDIPTMRMPRGVVAFISNEPTLAHEVCRESELQASGKVPVRCVAAGVASTAVSFDKVDGSADATVMPTFSGTLGLILFAAVMSLVASYLVLRSGRLNSRSNLDVVADVPTVSGLNNELQFIQQTEARTVVKLDYTSKRVFDIVFALLGIVIFSPLFLLVPVAIKLIDWRCPIVVSIRAVGKGGRPFRMHKFSTMVSDADKVLADLLSRDPVMRKEWEENHKLISDPRLLPVIGKFLRKFSINELPQFFNVLKGNMAIVGPRPISFEEETKYEQFGGANLLKSRHSIRPGITGLWQISGRNDISYRERVLIDAQYLQNCSLLLDFKILLKTVVVVFRGDGAY